MAVQNRRGSELQNRDGEELLQAVTSTKRKSVSFSEDVQLFTANQGSTAIPAVKVCIKKDTL